MEAACLFARLAIIMLMVYVCLVFSHVVNAMEVQLMNAQLANKATTSSTTDAFKHALKVISDTRLVHHAGRVPQHAEIVLPSPRVKLARLTIH